MLQKENEILKRKLESKNEKIKFNNNDRIFFAAIAWISKKISVLFSLVTPKTVLEWYRNLIKKFWIFPSWTNKGGRPRTPVHLRREALNWFIIFTEKQLRKIITLYMNYYNERRHHQGTDDIPAGYIPQSEGKIIKIPILSGLHHHYYRKTA